MSLRIRDLLVVRFLADCPRRHSYINRTEDLLFFQQLFPFLVDFLEGFTDFIDLLGNGT